MLFAQKSYKVKDLFAIYSRVSKKINENKYTKINIQTKQMIDKEKFKSILPK